MAVAGRASGVPGFRGDEARRTQLKFRLIHSVADCLSSWARGGDMAMSEGGRPHAAYDPAVIDVIASLSSTSTQGVKRQCYL